MISIKYVLKSKIYKNNGIIQIFEYHNQRKPKFYDNKF